MLNVMLFIVINKSIKTVFTNVLYNTGKIVLIIIKFQIIQHCKHPPVLHQALGEVTTYPNILTGHFHPLVTYTERKSKKVFQIQFSPTLVSLLNREGLVFSKTTPLITLSLWSLLINGSTS